MIARLYEAVLGFPCESLENACAFIVFLLIFFLIILAVVGAILKAILDR